MEHAEIQNHAHPVVLAASSNLRVAAGFLITLYQIHSFPRNIISSSIATLILATSIALLLIYTLTLHVELNCDAEPYIFTVIPACVVFRPPLRFIFACGIAEYFLFLMGRVD